MKISDAAKQSGLTTKAIRYYESTGLIDGTRLQNGYRDYSDSDITAMRFIHRARELGFSIESCRHLLELYQDPNRASANVKQVAKEHLKEIDAQMQRLQEMKTILETSVAQCPDDDSPECTIIDELAKSVE